MQNNTIRVGILGYGNLGRGVELALRQNPDMNLAGIFTRRKPDTIQTITGSAVYPLDQALSIKEEIDVMILCGGSATDLMEQSPEFARNFNIVDSFDTHARIPEHYRNVDQAAKAGGTIAVISAGWDPGLFSINRLYAGAVLPTGQDYTFWGPGISQGHSDALRRVAGVRDAKQYTLPVEGALEEVRRGANPSLATRQKHTRLCFVVAEEGADQERIREEIVGMPNYFSDYDTTVTFINQEELDRDHRGMPHGGFVLRSGTTGLTGESHHLYEFSLKLDSNPEFTSSVLVAYARAAYKLAAEGQTGARTVLDIPPSALSPRPLEDLIGELL
jgi:diaminopimelate dehydrogenase